MQVDLYNGHKTGGGGEGRRGPGWLFGRERCEISDGLANATTQHS